jgi:hypothetical protein
LSKKYLCKIFQPEVSYGNYKFLFVFFLLISIPVEFYAQTKIQGVVLNDQTGKGIPYANIFFSDSETNSLSDEKGLFFLEDDTQSDKLIIRSKGFINDTLLVLKDQYQDFIIYLKPVKNEPGLILEKNSRKAVDIVKNVLKRKKANNLNKLSSYSYEQYTKMRIDLNNVDPATQDEPKLEKFKFVFNGLDTSAATGKIYIPFMLTETLSDFYYQNYPRRRKEIINAVNFAGVENLSASKFTGQMYLEFNFYNNFINIIDKQFISPVSGTALLNYDYYLIDSAYNDDILCYNLIFKPKRKHEYTFTGNMWITDSTFALKNVSARMSKTANMGFVSDFYLKIDFDEVQPDFFFPSKEELFIDLNVTNFTYGISGKKYVEREKVSVNPVYPNFFFAPAEFRDIKVRNFASDFDSSEWRTLRHKPITEKETGIYKMVHKFKKQAAFKNIENFAYFLGTGYIRRGKIEVGPIYKFYGRNALEGHRLRLGGRTGNTFSKKIEFNGYLAFGLDDQRAKYGIGSKFKINREPWTMLTINHYKDFVQLGANLGIMGTDNIFNISEETYKLLMYENTELSFEKDLYKSLTSRISVSHIKIFPNDSMMFYDLSDRNITNLRTSELTLHLRIGLNEEYIEAVFNRLSFGSYYPIFDIEYTFGIPNVFDSRYKYGKLKVKMKHKIKYAYLGKTNYYFEAGKIFGDVPYPLFKLHEGVEGIGYNPYAFNLTGYYEFASDQYLSFFAEHHFNGLFLNKIPLIRKLKLREVIYAKGAWGSLRDDHQNIIRLPDAMKDISKPYVELGIGVENILKVLSINYFRRVTHLKEEHIRKDGIVFGFQVSF